MKVNLYAFDNEKIEGGKGYFNIHLSDYENFSEWVDAGECSEIRLNFCMNYINMDSFKRFLDTIVSRLEYGGKIYASSVDILDVAKKIYFRSLENQSNEDVITVANKLLYNGVANVLSIEYLDKLFKEMGLTVLQKRNINNECHIVGEFPKPTQISENTY